MDKVSQDDVKRMLNDTGVARMNVDAVWKELHSSYVSKTYIKEKVKIIMQCCEFLNSICSE